MSLLSTIWKLLDVALGIAIRADEVNERRKARKRFEDVVGEEKKDSGRSRAPTVVLRRPPE